MRLVRQVLHILLDGTRSASMAVSIMPESYEETKSGKRTVDSYDACESQNDTRDTILTLRTLIQ